MEARLVAYLTLPIAVEDYISVSWIQREEEWVLEEEDFWSIRLFPVQTVDLSDVPPEVLELSSDIGWLIEASVEAMEEEFFSTALRHARRLLKRVASAGNGAVQEDDFLWQNSRRIALSSSGGRVVHHLRLLWFFAGRNIEERQEKVVAIVDRVAEIAPKALPTRWGDREPLRVRLSDAGTTGLKRYVLDQLEPRPQLPTMTKSGSPFFDFSFRPVLCLGESRPFEYGILSFQIELEPNGLSDEDLDDLNILFISVAQGSAAFYAESRFVMRSEGETWGPLAPPPIEARNWDGFPHELPMALLAGDPYLVALEKSPGLSYQGKLAYYGRIGRVAVPSPTLEIPPILQQEFDPSFAHMKINAANRDRVSELISAKLIAPKFIAPSRIPEFWPFPIAGDV